MPTILLLDTLVPYVCNSKSLSSTVGAQNCNMARSARDAYSAENELLYLRVSVLNLSPGT